MATLVIYATEHGSTREIAERICERLRTAGLEADLKPVGQAVDLARYDAYVIGSAIHNQAWLPQAAEFAERHHRELADRPVWLFSVGVPHTLRGVWKYLATREEARVSASLRRSLRPRGHRLFSGVFRADHTTAFGGLAFHLMGGRFGDYRDWDAIDAWADEIARYLAPLLGPGHRPLQRGEQR